jgi:hypothetical protein
VLSSRTGATNGGGAARALRTKKSKKKKKKKTMDEWMEGLVDEKRETTSLWMGGHNRDP